MARVLTFPTITVAAINGHAFGAGAQLSLAHDFRVMRRDAPTHHSPNAGWPEAAMAAALGLALLGPRRYRGVLTAAPYLNAAGRRRATPDDIGRALRVYAVAWGLLFLLAATSGGLVIALS